MNEKSGPKKTDFLKEIQEYKKERIVEEAIRLFYERGYDGTSVEALASEIGVTKPFIYSYFSNKLAILEAVYEQSAKRVHQYVEQAAKGEGTPPERLEKFIYDFTIENIKHQIASSVYLQEEKKLSPEAKNRIIATERSFNNLLAQLIDKGCKQGYFKVEHPKLAALSIAGVVRWVHRWYSPKGKMKPPK